MKTRFPYAVGLEVAAELCRSLKASCERLIVAGSMRRRKPDVGDVEILYIGRKETRPDPTDMFAQVEVDLADEVVAALIKNGVLEPRPNVRGSNTYGPKIKLVRHRGSGMPVDLFKATEANWWNYLVCRTGPAESNTRICMAAQERGWKWNPFGPGFTKAGEVRPMGSEREVFEFVGLPFVAPEQR